MTMTAESAIQGGYPVAATPAPNYTLYDSRSVALATFLGSPVAGGVLMAMNYKRLGQAGKGAVTAFLCLLLTGLVILVSWNIPKGVSLPIALALMFGMQWAARAFQGKAVESHVAQGGHLGSRGTAAVIGLVFLAVILLAVVIPAYFIGSGPSIVENTKDNVYYTGTASKADAQALGDYLKDEKYLQDQGADVIVFKGKDKSGYNGTIVSFIVKEGSWNDPKMMAVFEQMTREIAPKLGGFPVEVRLLNKDRDVEKESVVGKADISGGGDHIYYFGNASDADAHALGLALTKAGFLEGKGFDVFLWKQSEGTTIGFVVSAGAWDDAAIVADFERIVKQAAPSVGGLPVHLKLMNGQMETKKDEVVQ
jgi:hypothetical protein